MDPEKPLQTSGLLSSSTVQRKNPHIKIKKRRSFSKIINKSSWGAHKINLAETIKSKTRSIKVAEAAGLGPISEQIEKGSEKSENETSSSDNIVEEKEEQKEKTELSEDFVSNDANYHPVLNPSAFKFNNYLKTNVDISVSNIGSHPYNDAHAHYDYSMYNSADTFNNYEVDQNGIILNNESSDENENFSSQDSDDQKGDLMQEVKNTEEGFKGYTINMIEPKSGINSSETQSYFSSQYAPNKSVSDTQSLNKSFISDTEHEIIKDEEMSFSTPANKIECFFDGKPVEVSSKYQTPKIKHSSSILSGVHKITGLDTSESVTPSTQKYPLANKKRRMSLVDYIKTIGDIDKPEESHEKTVKYEASAVLSDYDLKARKYAKEYMKTDTKFSSIPENSTEYFVVFEELTKEEIERLKKLHGPPKKFFDGRTKLPLELIYGATIAKGYGSRLQTKSVLEAYRRYSLVDTNQIPSQVNVQKRMNRRSSLALGFIEKGVSLASDADIKMFEQEHRGVKNYNPQTDQFVSPTQNNNQDSSVIESVNPSSSNLLSDDILKDVEYSEIAKAGISESINVSDEEAICNKNKKLEASNKNNSPHENKFAVRRHSSLRFSQNLYVDSEDPSEQENS